MIIQHNMAAENGMRMLKINDKNKSLRAERLGSGYRINRGADDAAGLAISEEMRAQIRGLRQASKNSQDGISLLNTADAGMQEMSAMIHRIRELAVQSANDTNTSQDRQAIQMEVDEICAEIDRFSSDTEFNTIHIFDNSWGHSFGQVRGFAAVVGANNITPNGRLSQTLTSAQILDFVNGTSNATNSINRTVLTARTQVQSQTTAYTYSAFSNAGTAYTGNIYNSTGVLLGSISAAGVLSLNAQGQAALPANSTVNTPGGVNTTTTLLKNYVDPTSIVATQNNYNNGTGTPDISNPTNTATDNYTAANSTIYGAGNVVLNYTRSSNITSVVHTWRDYADANENLAGAVIDFKGLNKPGGFQKSDLYNLGFNSTCATCNRHYSIQFTSSSSFSLDTYREGYTEHLTLKIGLGSLNASATGEDLANLIMDTLKDSANSSFVNHYTQYAVKGSQLYVVDNRSSILNSSGRSDTFDAVVYGTPDLYPEERIPFTVQVGANSNQTISLILPWINCERLGINNISVETQQSAEETLDRLDFALSYLNDERSHVGAWTNRLEHCIAVDDNTSENLQDAESKIRDADMAEEMMELAKAQILEQAGMSVLAQANSSGEGILSLLRG